jgi:hypothetical protein
MDGTFGITGYIVLAVYMAVTVLLGLSFTRKQKNLAGYFLAERSAPWWAVGISILACDLSAISYMGAPALAYYEDLRYAMTMFLFPFVALIVAHLFVPFLARLRVLTIYEYLEHRFGLDCRLFASAVFLLQRASHIAIAIYAVSLALQQIVGWPVSACVAVVGGLTTLYTVFGGMKAVLWTDVMQFFVLIGGLVAMAGVVLWSFHGDVGRIWQIAADAGHTKMFTFDYDFLTPSFWLEMTFWGLFLGTLVSQIGVWERSGVGPALSCRRLGTHDGAIADLLRSSPDPRRNIIVPFGHRFLCLLPHARKRGSARIARRTRRPNPRSQYGFAAFRAERIAIGLGRPRVRRIVCGHDVGVLFGAKLAEHSHVHRLHPAHTAIAIEPRGVDAPKCPIDHPRLGRLHHPGGDRRPFHANRLSCEDGRGHHCVFQRTFTWHVSARHLHVTRPFAGRGSWRDLRFCRGRVALQPRVVHLVRRHRLRALCDRRLPFQFSTVAAFRQRHSAHDHLGTPRKGTLRQ